MDKDINDYTYGDLQGDIKLKSFIEHGTPAEIDISGIKKKAFLKMHQHERKSRQRRVLMYIGSVAATLFFLIGIKYIITEDAMDGLSHMEVTELMADAYDEEVEVPVGEKMTLLLADGTKIVANSRTIVRYPKRFDGDCREVYVKGEAYLDSQVVLVQGAVELKTTNNDRVRMKPNELVNLQEGSFAEKRTVNTDEYTCWMQGVINLDGESVESVAQRLSHYYGVTILFDDGMSADRIYGKLMLGDHVSEALQAIETMTRTRMEIRGDTIYLVKK